MASGACDHGPGIDSDTVIGGLWERYIGIQT